MIKKRFNRKSTLKIVCVAFLLSLIGCNANPQNADIDINETLPETKTSVYDKAINSYGLMQNIYDVRSDATGRDNKADFGLRVMVDDIADVTGSSNSTMNEIPQNVTEMVRSTLNGIGGRVQYIPFDANMLVNMVNLKYTDLKNKKKPDVILSGGITEFDRGLVTKGDSSDVGVDVKDYGVEFSDQAKSSLASITLDFNLIDFKTQAGIPKMQAINSVKVHKATREDSIGFTIKGVTFGAKGEIKRVQGRHAAVRLIVQLSVLQILGRYQMLPYWTLIPGAESDYVVIDQVVSNFYKMTPTQRIMKAQEYLYLHGYNVNINGQIDVATQSALSDFSKKHKFVSEDINKDTYLALFETVPVNHETEARRNVLNSMLGTDTMSSMPTLVTFSQPTLDTKPGNIQLSTSKPTYTVGEAMTINYSVDKPMYVRMIIVNSKGEVSTLLPNDYQSDNLLKPNVQYTLPEKNAGFTLNVGLPAGTDKIYAVASNMPIAAQDMRLTSSNDLDVSKMPKNIAYSTAQYTIRK